MSITSDLGKFQYLKKTMGTIPYYSEVAVRVVVIHHCPPWESGLQRTLKSWVLFVSQPEPRLCQSNRQLRVLGWTVNSQLAGNYAATQTTSGAQWETKKPSIRTFIIIILHGLFTLVSLGWYKNGRQLPCVLSPIYKKVFGHKSYGCMWTQKEVKGNECEQNSTIFHNPTHVHVEILTKKSMMKKQHNSKYGHFTAFHEYVAG